MSTELVPVADHAPLAHLPADQQRARARDMARAEPALTGVALAARFGRRERWGRQQIAAARNDTPPARRTGTPGGTTSDAGTPPAERTGTPDPRAARTGTGKPSTSGAVAERAAAGLTGAALAVVVLAPMAVSAHSLAGWARDALGLGGPWPWAVPVTLDCAALVCAGLTFHAMLRGDSAGAARLLVWLFAAASAAANWRHGAAISPDAEAYYPAMPVVAAVLLDLTFRRVQRGALTRVGALERPLPRYRAVRWLVAPRETWSAWSTAVRDGITDPDQAVNLARQRRAARTGHSNAGPT